MKENEGTSQDHTPNRSQTPTFQHSVLLVPGKFVKQGVLICGSEKEGKHPSTPIYTHL